MVLCLLNLLNTPANHFKRDTCWLAGRLKLSIVEFLDFDEPEYFMALSQVFLDWEEHVT
jgi:hypothetical protein